jgi:hypothetical protein
MREQMADDVTWLSAAARVRRESEFRPIPRRFLYLTTTSIDFGTSRLIGRIRARRSSSKKLGGDAGRRPQCGIVLAL